MEVHSLPTIHNLVGDRSETWLLQLPHYVSHSFHPNTIKKKCVAFAGCVIYWHPIDELCLIMQWAFSGSAAMQVQRSASSAISGTCLDDEGDAHEQDMYFSTHLQDHIYRL